MNNPEKPVKILQKYHNHICTEAELTFTDTCQEGEEKGSTNRPPTKTADLVLVSFVLAIFSNASTEKKIQLLKSNPTHQNSN